MNDFTAAQQGAEEAKGGCYQILKWSLIGAYFTQYFASPEKVQQKQQTTGYLVII